MNRKIPWLLPALFMLTFSAFSQSHDSKIKDIRKKYGIIESSIQKKKTTKQYFEYQCPENNEMGRFGSYTWIRSFGK